MLSIKYIPPGGWPEGITLTSLPIPGRDGYSINEAGHIRSCKRRGSWDNADEWHAVSTFWNDERGWTFRFSSGKRIFVTVASLVMLTHGPERPSPKHWLCFLDRDRRNHCLWNLEWLLPQEAFDRGLFMSPSDSLRAIRKRQIQERLARGASIDEGEIVRSMHEYLNTGRPLRSIWLDRYQHNIRLKSFTKRVYVLIKKKGLRK